MARNGWQIRIWKQLGIMMGLVILFGGLIAFPAFAANGVSVQVERVPSVSQKSSGAVKIGTVHIAEDRDMPEAMLEGDYLELILPSGVTWSDKTVVYFQAGGSNYKEQYEEGKDYYFSGDRYLGVSLRGVTDDRDVLTVEPWVELDGFGGGKIYLSIESDLLGPNNETVSAGQCISYGITVGSKGDATGTAGEKFTSKTIILQETNEGSFHMGEDIEITLPEGFVLDDSKQFMAVKVSGSDIFDTPQRKSDNVAVLPVKRLSGSPVGVEITLNDILSPEDFSGEVVAQLKGDLISESIVIAELDAAETEEITSPEEETAKKELKQQLRATFWIQESTSLINGVSTQLESDPYIKDGYVYLPVRYVAYALGISDENIEWDPALKMVTLKKDETIVQLTVGSSHIVVNGVVQNMDVVPEISNGLTMLPVRWVVEAFNGEVQWDAESSAMVIYTYEEV